jgi:hypothetical protein
MDATVWKHWTLFLACSLFVMATVNVLQIAYHCTTVQPLNWDQGAEIAKLAAKLIVTSLMYFGAVRFGQQGL